MSLSSRVFAFIVFFLSLSEASTAAAMSPHKCVDIFSSMPVERPFAIVDSAGLHSTERQKALWDALTIESPWMSDGFLQAAQRISKDFSVSERLEFLRTIHLHPERVNAWIAEFVMVHFVKTKGEDSVHGLSADQILQFALGGSAEIATALAKEHKRFLPILSASQRSILIQEYIEKHPTVMQYYGEAFGVSETQITKIYNNLAEERGLMVIRKSKYSLGGSGFAESHRRYGYFPVDIPPQVEKRILQKAFANDALNILVSHELFSVSALQASYPIVAKDGKPSVVGILQEVATRYPDLLDAEVVPLLWDRVKNLHVGFRLLREYDRLKERGVAHIQMSSLGIFSEALGYDFKSLDQAVLSERQMTQLYELSLDINYNLKSPAFLGRSIDAAAFKPSNIQGFLSLLGALRDLTHLYGNDPAAWNRAWVASGTGDYLSAEMLTLALQRTRQAVAVAFRETFRENQILIREEELSELYQKWGSLEPIITLVARFKGRAEWKKEIPVLGKILKSVLANQFLSLKYEGQSDDALDRQAAQDQLSVLKTPGAILGWRKNRSEVDFFDPNRIEKESESARWSQAQLVIETNLRPHLGGRLQGAVLDGMQKDRLLLQILATRQSPSPKFLAEANNVGLDVLGRTLLQSLFDVKEGTVLRKLATFIKNNAGAFDLSAETLGDLSALVSALSVAKKGSPSIVFTSSFDDPKMMIMIGDLVDSYSCQNYRTGSYIETLLGYVLDAGLKGMVSFPFQKEHFPRRSDFGVLQQALIDRDQGRRVKIQSELVADKSFVKFIISRDGSGDVLINTLPLSKASQRRILKLGQLENGSGGLILERVYEQTHAARSLMQDQANRILQSTAAAIGGSIGSAIDIPASRNPGGVYSDAAGGVMVGPYRIEKTEF